LVNKISEEGKIPCIYAFIVSLIYIRDKCQF
jgi:hypothetical protein